MARGRDVERVEEAAYPADHREQADDAEKGGDTDAAGAHGGDLAVGGEAAEAQQDADEHGHRQHQREEVRHEVAEQPEQVEWRGDAADEEFQERQKVPHQQDEREQQAAQEGVADDLAEDVAGEYAHFRIRVQGRGSRK